MVSSVSFKGIYTINSSQNKHFYPAVDCAYIAGEADKNFEEIKFDDSSFVFKVGKDFESRVESYLLSQGVNFKKADEKSLLTEQSIKSRIVQPAHCPQPEYQMVEIKTDKFNEAYKKYCPLYIGDEGDIIQPERTERLKEYIKQGIEIDASIVYINDSTHYPQISFQDGRHRYAYYRDMGMKTIPVVMKRESIATAKKYGLLAD